MFKLPEEVKSGIKVYKHSLDEMLEGKLSQARFKGIRVPWGIYSQRGGQVYMNRIRIPAGIVTPAQLKALARAASKYGSGKLHITTRQDIQIHEVKIKNTIEVMEFLKEYDLSPRGGGGNTVRNVIACPCAGICPEETFDIRSHTIGLTEYLLRQDSSFNLPRKFKIAFSCCAKDCAGCLVNDVGFLAKEKNGEKGFTVYSGGGMGANSCIGRLLEEFIPASDLGYVTLAIKNVFHKKGDRRNKHHNRLRFLIKDIGFDEFEKLYREEFQKLKENEYIALRKIDFPIKEEQDEPLTQNKDGEYKAFLSYNVKPQKQKGFYSVTLRISRGEISSDQLTRLAGLEDNFSGIEFRATQNQNIIITWIKMSDVYNLFLKLKDILNNFLYSNTLLDVVSCKGALTCNLGLCNSPALTREIEKVIEKECIGTEVFKKLQIKLNGCSNSCGHHPIGKVSLYGLVRKVDNRPVPFYKFCLGGRTEAEFTQLAGEAGMIPARNVPLFLKDFFKKVEEKISPDEDIYVFLEKRAKEIARSILKDYSYVPSYSENKDFYIDWGRTEEFTLAGLGQGECGAGVIDMIESDLTDARLVLEAREEEAYSSENIKKVLFFSSRALLVVKGKEPRSEEETFEMFKEILIDTGIARGDYSAIKEEFNGINDKLTLEERKEKFSYAKQFYDHIIELYDNMDSSFNFAKQDDSAIGADDKEKKEAVAKTIDLKGTPCPINYVKTKLVLENLNSGDILEVLLDEGEPIENVPKSLRDDGHDVLEIEKQNGFYKVVVKKK